MRRLEPPSDKQWPKNSVEVEVGRARAAGPVRSAQVEANSRARVLRRNWSLLDARGRSAWAPRQWTAAARSSLDTTAHVRGGRPERQEVMSEEHDPRGVVVITALRGLADGIVGLPCVRLSSVTRRADIGCLSGLVAAFACAARCDRSHARPEQEQQRSKNATARTHPGHFIPGDRDPATPVGKSAWRGLWRDAVARRVTLPAGRASPAACRDR